MEWKSEIHNILRKCTILSKSRQIELLDEWWYQLLENLAKGEEQIIINVLLALLILLQTELCLECTGRIVFSSESLSALSFSLYPLYLLSRSTSSVFLSVRLFNALVCFAWGRKSISFTGKCGPTVPSVPSPQSENGKTSKEPLCHSAAVAIQVTFTKLFGLTRGGIPLSFPVKMKLHYPGSLRGKIFSQGPSTCAGCVSF